MIRSLDDYPREAVIPQTFGCVLREYRLAAGLSQQTLAEMAHISTQAVGALERGVRRYPQRRTLALLIAALQLEAHEGARLSLLAARQPRPRRRLIAPVTERRADVVCIIGASRIGEIEQLLVMISAWL